MDRHLPAVPVLRVGSSLHLDSFFPTPGGRRGSARSPPALMADVRIVIRRNFPAGPMGPIVDRVAVDIALRRQPSRNLRCPERVERALAEHVVPFVKHSFDRRAVAIASKKICWYVSGACADPRLAYGGVQVLVLLDTFACPTLLRPAPRPREHSSTGSPEFGVPVRTPTSRVAPPTSAEHGGDILEICRCMKIGVKRKEQQRSVGTIGDGRLAKDGGVDRLQGWVPW
ncbi:hypothetical protein GUJ93_ZPchr0003g17647 [Zizania palustris]|uniref:Uncharacterized protein n=1 Tax=Zizania palustris TaxID=103762 RepID=A0A8J5S3Y8_ZIZPA|nr:hypothetical protein GUJ93_ZPchr0003g17647 [Zizania palustris]